jgi:hypothetical protein
MFQKHCPQPGSTRYGSGSGTGTGVPGHTKPASRRSAEQSSEISQRCCFCCLCTAIRALYRMACSIRGPRLLQRLRQKRELVSRQFEGGGGAARFSWQWRCFLAFLPSPSSRANNEVLRCHRTLLMGSSSTERNAAFSIGHYVQFICTIICIC